MKLKENEEMIQEEINTEIQEDDYVITPEKLDHLNRSRNLCEHCYFPLFSFAMIKNLERAQ